MNINAKSELLSILENKAKILCALIYNANDWYNSRTAIALKVGYSNEQYQNFLEQMNFEYNIGYSGKQLFGTIWLEDGTLLTREESEGLEWWEHHKIPKIPDELF